MANRKSPYNGRTAEHREWVRGYEDRLSGRPFHSSLGQPSAILAYNQGWRAADFTIGPE